MKKYSGQAIAIIMIILVVAAVIGASLYSRMIRNKGEVIDTRESSKALEQSGNILDSFITTDIRLLQTEFFDVLEGATDNKIVIQADTLGELNTLVKDQVPPLDLELTDLGSMDASCSNYKVSIEYALPSEGPEYKVGDVMAINLSGVTVPSTCHVDLTFSPSNRDRVFAVKKVYSDGSSGYKKYELEDMKLYCLLNTNGCSNVAPSTSFESDFTTNVLPIDMTTVNLEEIRVIPLKGTIEIGVSSTDCGNIFNQFLIKATTVCSGQERTMQVIIPSATNYGYPALFDYTIYNSNGALAPVVP